MGLCLLKRSQVKRSCSQGLGSGCSETPSSGQYHQGEEVEAERIEFNKLRTVYKHAEGQSVFSRCPLSPPSKAVEWGFGHGQKQAEIALSIFLGPADLQEQNLNSGHQSL